MKAQILLLTLLMAIPSVQAQDFFKKQNEGKKIVVCYISSVDEHGVEQGIWAEQKTAEFFCAMEKDEVVIYQKLMKEKVFEVNTVGYIDKKTIEAHAEFQKILKKENRKKRRQQRSTKRKKR